MHLDIEREVGLLRQMPTRQLRERYAELFGERTRSGHRTYLVRKVAWKLQVLAEGDLSERARRRAAALAQGTELRLMPPTSAAAARPTPIEAKVGDAPDRRLPMPGAMIVRDYKGRRLQVLVTADGFEFEGQRFKSLSAAAKAITGSHVNGFRFFGLEGKS